MPTFIKIGPLKRNLSGITSKGYVMYRKLNIVYIKFGPINSETRRFYWAGKVMPTSIKRKFRTNEKAIIFYKNRINEMIRDDYKKLPPGKNIMKCRD